jgi:hypothetical protein
MRVSHELILLDEEFRFVDVAKYDFTEWKIDGIRDAFTYDGIHVYSRMFRGTYRFGI